MGRVSLDATGFRHLLDAMGALKHMGNMHEDTQRLWCADWASTTADTDATTESKAQVAKIALSRMKLVAKTLAAISSSVEEMIELVTSESSSFILTADFNSLPDDILARIFELCASWGEYDGGFVTNYVSSQLSSVCRRFRHVALRLPCLWENVSNYHTDEWALLLKSRCLKPAVFVITLEEDTNGGDNFFQLLKPANQWKELDIDVHNFDLHDVLESVSARSGGDFSDMESLKIGSVLEDDEWYEEYEPPTTNLSDSDDALISSWRLPSLRALTIQNIIPSYIHCPNLRSCTISLSSFFHLCIWDFGALKAFLRSVHLVESLSLTFVDAGCSSVGSLADSDPIKFPRLTSLAIEAGRETKPKVLKHAMDAIEAEKLTTLEVSLDNDGLHKSYKFTDWLAALFTSSTGKPRTFASVNTFNLHLKPDKGDYLPDEKTLLALPHLQNLYLDLPITCRLNLYDVFRTVKDLRTLRLENSPRYDDVWSLETRIRSRAREKNDECGSIEEVEFRGFGPLSFHTKEVEKLLGEKFIQGGSYSSPPS